MVRITIYIIIGPCSPQFTLLPHKTSLLCTSFIAPAKRLIVVEERVSIKHDQLIKRANPQAVIDIIECHFKALIKTAKLIEYGTFRHHTGSSNSGKILRDYGPAHITRVVTVNIIEDVNGATHFVLAVAINH